MNAHTKKKARNHETLMTLALATPTSPSTVFTCKNPPTVCSVEKARVFLFTHYVMMMGKSGIKHLPELVHPSHFEQLLLTSIPPKTNTPRVALTFRSNNS